MDEIKKKGMSPFNTTFELGIRMVYLLSALGSRGADLQKLILLDYAVIYSDDLDGPTSLHTPVPFRGSEIYSRRALIQAALHLMASKGLISVSISDDGVSYVPGEQSRVLVASMASSYARRLAERCAWVAKTFGESDSTSLTVDFIARGQRWGAEFEAEKIRVE